MATDRYRSPRSSRGSSSKKRRHRYDDSLEAEKYSDLDSRSSTSSSSETSTCGPGPTPSSIASSTRHRHTNDGHRDTDAHSSRNSHSRHRHHKQLRHHHRKALPAPDEEDEKSRYSTAVTIREEYPVQTVPRTHQRDLSPDEEEVYDHRPRPLSQRHGDRYPERHRAQSESHRANTADQGFLMAAVMVIVSLFICMGEAD